MRYKLFLFDKVALAPATKGRWNDESNLILANGAKRRRKLATPDGYSLKFRVDLHNVRNRGQQLYYSFCMKFNRIWMFMYRKELIQQQYKFFNIHLIYNDAELISVLLGKLINY